MGRRSGRSGVGEKKKRTGTISLEAKLILAIGPGFSGPARSPEKKPAQSPARPEARRAGPSPKPAAGRAKNGFEAHGPARAWHEILSGRPGTAQKARLWACETLCRGRAGFDRGRAGLHVDGSTGGISRAWTPRHLGKTACRCRPAACETLCRARAWAQARSPLLCCTDGFTFRFSSS
jgi:hypothetical protein